MNLVAASQFLVIPPSPARAIVTALLRCAFALCLIVCLASAVDLGSSVGVLGLSAALGIFMASALGFSRLSHAGFVVLLAIASLFVWLSLQLLSIVPVAWLPSIFSIYTFEVHLQLILLSFGVGAMTTWLFWRWSHAVTVEVMLLLAFVLYQAADYRNFNFRVSQTIGAIAWYLGISHLTALIVVGVMVVVGVGLYLYCATLPGRPVAGVGRAQRKIYPGRAMILLATGLVLAIAGYLYMVSNLTFRHFHDQTYDKNGVGMGADEKMSPLDFHSALGGTNQPSALVRLDGDYNQNPFTPMLYLREAALSEFDGQKIVKADRTYDTDVSGTTPEEPFVGPEDTDLGVRTPMVQSVYLLADHKNAFAIDYPISIDLLKNPNPKRFKAAYRAYSVAPAYSLDDLKSSPVGDSRWNDIMRSHYTAPHSDVRYKNLAEQLTQGISDPVEKAFAIVDYLNENAIYTLAPGHDVKEGEDPVVPFLFGDMRGYCVHFAHATVYMLRALGIPSRIGTGYLTDLSQSKDGHILLRMSDRHAWAEVYIDKKGWIPFDTKPQHVESHAETPVDMKLLEELMDMLGPDEEILPKDSAKGEKGMEEDSAWVLPGRRVLLIPLIVVTVLIVLTKVFMLYGWVLVRNPSRRLTWVYRAMLSRLYAIGIRRQAGETRQEFQARVAAETGRDLLLSTVEVGKTVYAPLQTVSMDSEMQLRKASMRQWSTLRGWKRLWSALNPAPVFFSWARGKW